MVQPEELLTLEEVREACKLRNLGTVRGWISDGVEVGGEVRRLSTYLIAGRRMVSRTDLGAFLELFRDAPGKMGQDPGVRNRKGTRKAVAGE